MIFHQSAPTASQRSSMYGRRSITTKASFSDDEDAITPCSTPPPEPQQQASHYESRIASRFSFSRRQSNSAATTAAQAWHFDPTDGEDMDDAKLWRRMLEIQKEFHCYNSARMAAALLELEMGVDVGPYAPPRSCLDLLNDGVSDMPVDDRERLIDWLHEHSTRRRRSGIFKRSSGL